MIARPAPLKTVLDGRGGDAIIGRMLDPVEREQAQIRYVPSR